MGEGFRIGVPVALRPEHERTRPLRPEPILRLPDLYFAKFRISAEFFSTLAMHLRALTNFPLRRLRSGLGPTAQRIPSQKTHLLHQALFRSVSFRQFPLVAFDRQHDR